MNHDEAGIWITSTLVGHGEGSIGKVWASKVDAEMRREEDGIIVAYQENNKRKEEKGTQQKNGKLKLA